MKTISSTLAFICLMITSGCAVLPIPHTRTVIPEISGQLIFEDEGLRKAENKYTYHYSASSDVDISGVLTTDESGFFKIEETRDWYYIVLLSFIGHQAWGCSFEIFSDDNLIFLDSVLKYPGDSFHKAPIDCGKIIVNEPLDREVEKKKAANENFSKSVWVLDENAEPVK